MDFQDLIIEKQSEIAWVTLNRPESHNALSKQLAIDLIKAIESLDTDETVALIVLGGAGPSFCAGADLSDEGMVDAAINNDRPALYGPWDAVEQANKPVIAAVHGYAITGGYLLATACDLVIASEDAKFADTHAKWGLIPFGAEPQRLIKLVGVKKAKELMFTSKMISAAEAERYGLINQVVPRDQLKEKTLEMANAILENSQPTVRTIKHLINFGSEFGYTAGKRMETLLGNRGMFNVQSNERTRIAGKFKK